MGGVAGPVQASSLSCATREPSRLRTITIMKSVRFSNSLFVSYYFLVLKVINLLLFSPSRPSNCIDCLLIEKDNIILTTFIEKIHVEWYLLKIRLNKVECILKCKLINNV